MGRPKELENATRRSIYVPDDLWEAFSKKAKSLGGNVSARLRWLMERDLKD